MGDEQVILKEIFGYDSFRPGQGELVDAILSGHDVLGIMPTGAGKSICYQVPALCMNGITLVVSPLISLMKDQVESLVQAGVAAAYLNSSLTLGQQRTVLARAAEGRYKGRLCAYIGYNEELSHRVYAGADFLLMPSRFEPCGLSQMIAMRYGTLPIVRETGGLKDSVKPYNKYTGEGTGFSFKNFNAHEMKEVMLLAMDCYRDPEIMNSLIRQAMEADFSFKRSSEEYARLYLWML